MAEALFNARANPNKARAISAGTDPAARVHAEVMSIVRTELDVDLSHHVPQKLTDDLARRAQWLITMGCGDQCPVVPGIRRDDWPIPDPKGQAPKTVRAIMADIDARVRALVAGQGWG
jgi:arsenate reductase